LLSDSSLDFIPLSESQQLANFQHTIIFTQSRFPGLYFMTPLHSIQPDMRSTRFLIMISLSVWVCSFSFGQKFGHVNASLLVQNHPGIPAANAELEAYRKSVSDPFDTKTKAFQTKYQFFMEEMQAGTLSKVSAENRQQELQKEQDALNKEGQEIQYNIMQKRDLVLRPILAK
jgi:Skp family chaperone for outer membrane proteins